MSGLWHRVLSTTAPRSAILIRLMVGGVFLSEGIQKFLFPAELGTGRFERIGIPMPELMGPFVGVVETVCGGLILIGLATRPAAVLLLITMSVAILSTKIPILLGYGFWGFHVRQLSRYGFWSMAHESRTDFSMWLGSLFLTIVGAGILSVDARMAPRKRDFGAEPVNQEGGEALRQVKRGDSNL